MGFFKKVLFVIIALIAASATFIAYLNYNEPFRKKFFSGLLKYLVDKQTPSFKETRCNLLAPLQGRVLEIGPGTGINFECLMNHKAITEYIGIEKNAEFKNSLDSYREKLPFKTTILYNAAESMKNIESNSVDAVFAVHVLCSVDNTTQVLQEILRVLKPEGKFYFIEHVSAPDNTWISLLQKLVSPVWQIIGDGCKFIKTWEDLEKVKGFKVEYRHFDADMPIALARPHIRGVATKILNQ